MDIKQEINGFKTLLSQRSELLVLRLRMLRLDAEDQLIGFLKIFAFVALSAVFLLVGLVALLLGLNVVLPDAVKIWVFFGSAIFALLCVLGLVAMIPVMWRKNRAHLGQTLNEIQSDFARLSGQRDNKEM